MFTFPLQFEPNALLEELIDLQRKTVQGLENMSHLRER